MIIHIYRVKSKTLFEEQAGNKYNLVSWHLGDPYYLVYMKTSYNTQHLNSTKHLQYLTVGPTVYIQPFIFLFETFYGFVNLF